MDIRERRHRQRVDRTVATRYAVASVSTSPIQVHRSLDLGAIDAIGFDLDHTLALYDDAEVNRLATAAACRMLVEERSFPEALLAPVPVETPAAGRTLAADLTHGAVVKLGAGRRVRRARLRGCWLDLDDIRRCFPREVADDAATAYSIYSPFSLPVLWLMETMERLVPAGEARAQRCEDIRHMLDLAHTNGMLKQQLREDLARYVRGMDGVRPRLEAWKAAGKRLFIVTNSEADFAPGVLDMAVGRGWQPLFDAVVMHAHKPAFFGERASDLEATLATPPDRILYVGDNTKSDIRAARDHGWHTVQVVPELADDENFDAWGHPLLDAGEPTWLSQRIRVADAACANAGDLLGLDPCEALVPSVPTHGDTA